MLHQGHTTQNVPCFLVSKFVCPGPFLLLRLPCSGPGSPMRTVSHTIFPLSGPSTGASLSEQPCFQARGCRAERCSLAGVCVATGLLHCIAATSPVGLTWAALHTILLQAGHAQGASHCTNPTACADSAQPQGRKPETGWLQRSHMKANSVKLAGSCLFTYLFWMCHRGCQT